MLQVGIVGLPNVGKSTLFKTLTKKAVDCANFPFCTIEPNVGVVEVPDDRLFPLAKKVTSEKIVPAAIEFVDIAGLVKGAHKGEGLGNKFLATIREVDMIVHVVRAFEDADVHHVDGTIDSLRDAEIIETELAMADLETVAKRFGTIQSKMKSGKTKELEKELSALEAINVVLEQGIMAHTVELDMDQQKLIKSLSLLTRKPVLYVLNVGEDQLAQPPALEGKETIALSIKVESEIAEMAKEDQQIFLQELGLEQSGLDRLIKRAYQRLNLITYFTCGPKETRAWTITQGMSAPQAAGVIHTDFEKGFIRAEVIDWKDLIELGEQGAKEAGKMRLEGKEYIMRDGDVCHFRVAT